MQRVIFHVVLYHYLAKLDALFLSTGNSQNASKCGKTFSCAAHFVSSHVNVICALQEHWRNSAFFFICFLNFSRLALRARSCIALDPANPPVLQAN